MELEVKTKQTNVVSQGVFNGQTVEFNYSYTEGEKPNYVSFKVLDTDTVISGGYHADSNQLTVVANGVESEELNVIAAIHTQCVELTTTPEEE